MTLVFSFVGFESQEVEVGNRNTIDVAMGGATELQEVVVKSQNENSFSKKLSGKTAGVNVGMNYKPFPTSGQSAFNKYIKDSIIIPKIAQENNIEGIVKLKLNIDSTGTITNIEVLKSLGYGCDEEAIRLIKEGPEWSPAIKNGNPVNDSVNIKVEFELEN